MPKNRTNIADAQIDGASSAELSQMVERLGLNVPRHSFWIFKECTHLYRERVRTAVRTMFLQINAGD